MMGIVCIITGSVSNTLALGFGNQTMFAGATSLTLCINSILGTFLLKETLSRMDILGIVISMIGSFLYLLNAKEKDAEYTEKGLFDLLFRPGGIMFLLLSFMSILGVYFFYRHVVSELQLAYAFMKSVVQSQNNYDRLENTPEDKDRFIEIRHLKYLIEAIYTVDVEQVPRYKYYNLNQLRKKLNTLMVILPVSAAFISAIQTVFMRCFTISAQMPGGGESIQTYAYLVMACTIAVNFQLKFIYLFLNLY